MVWFVLAVTIVAACVAGNAMAKGRREKQKQRSLEVARRKAEERRNQRTKPRENRRGRVMIAGKPYTLTIGNWPDLSDLTVTPLREPWEEDARCQVFRDIHGRDVIYTRKLFPCFDEFDWETETRHYHDFLIFHEEGVSAVRLADESGVADVRERVVRKDLDLLLGTTTREALRRTSYWQRVPESSE